MIGISDALISTARNVSCYANDNLKQNNLYINKIFYDDCVKIMSHFLTFIYARKETELPTIYFKIFGMHSINYF